MVDRLRLPVSRHFNLTKSEKVNMTFYDLVKYTDAIFARKFEGVSKNNFTRSQIRDIFEVGKWF